MADKETLRIDGRIQRQRFQSGDIAVDLVLQIGGLARAARPFAVADAALLDAHGDEAAARERVQQLRVIRRKIERLLRKAADAVDVENRRTRNARLRRGDDHAVLGRVAAAIPLRALA